MAMSEYAANGGADNPAVSAAPLADAIAPIKTEFKQVGPGQYGYVTVDEDSQPKGHVIRGEFSGEAFGEDQTGFDTVELPAVTFDHTHE